MSLTGERLTELSFYLSTACAATYLSLFILIVTQARLGSNRVLAASCLATSLWSFVAVVWPKPMMSGAVGTLDMVRMLSWYLYLLTLYRQSGVAPTWHVRGFVAIALAAVACGIGALVQEHSYTSYSLLSFPIVFRLILSVCELLLIENLFLNIPEHARWHVALPCILLGGIACLDILTTADAVLFHRPSAAMASTRIVVMLIIAPLLVLAAIRGQRWNEPVKLSKTAVFHSATLVLSGLVLLTLGVFGEVLRYVDNELGWIAELSLLSGGSLALLVVLTSRSARSMMNRVVIYHFFADRFDYRLQWLRCIATLSGTGSNERTTLATRAIRAIADVVDSPSGSLLLREPSNGVVTWAGSWNASAGPVILPESLLEKLSKNCVIEIDASLGQKLLGPDQPAWLAVPLMHASDVIGLVVVGSPRTRFRLDQEVFDLLGIIGREVATHIVERQATESVHQTQHLHDFGKRFSFVAHDIKNVSSQLALLIQNADTYLANPDFQLDMIQTVRSSVAKIDGLLKRLDQPVATGSLETLAPGPRLEALLATYRRVRKAEIVFTDDGSTGEIVISANSFETAITHLLNNAIEASRGQLVRVSVEHKAEKVVIDISDRGPGMCPEFVRDQLFTPFKTSKDGGSGIGAYQARELLHEAGGQLTVLTEPGMGTTMRIVLARADRPTITISEQLMSLAGGVSA